MITNTRIATKLRIVLCSLGVIGLAACGGGGSSDSGGGGGIRFGTYIGSASGTITGGGMTQQISGGIQFVVSANNVVTVSDPGDPPVAEGPLTGNTFTILVPASFINQPGITCAGAIAVGGTISGTTMNGTMSSDGFTCNGITFTLSATFTANLTNNASLTGQPDGALKKLINTIRKSAR